MTCYNLLQHLCVAIGALGAKPNAHLRICSEPEQITKTYTEVAAFKAHRWFESVILERCHCSVSVCEMGIMLNEKPGSNS